MAAPDSPRSFKFPLSVGQRRWLRRILQATLAVLILFFVVRHLQGQWDQIRRENLTINPLRLFAAQLCLTIGMGLQPLGSWVIVRALGSKSSVIATWHAFFLGQVAKYLPGSIWSLPSRAYLYHQRGLPAGRSVEAIYWEMGITVVGATVIGLPGLALLDGFRYQFLIAAGLISFCVVYLAVSITFQIRPVRRTLKKWLLPTPLASLFNVFEMELPLSTLALLILIYVIDWVIIGLGLALLVSAFQVDLSAQHWLQLIGLFSSGWAVGFLVIITPGGIGVRDGLLAVGVGALASTPIPLAVAVLARIGWTIAEVIGLSISHLLYIRAGNESAKQGGN